MQIWEKAMGEEVLKYIMWRCHNRLLADFCVINLETYIKWMMFLDKPNLIKLTPLEKKINRSEMKNCMITSIDAVNLSVKYNPCLVVVY